MKCFSQGSVLAAGLLICSLSTSSALGVLNFTVSDVSGWPSQAHHDAAVTAIQAVVNRYNAYGNFGNYNVWVYYNAGIPTAQASYGGSIGFGGTYPAERVTQHEMAHYLGLPSSGWSTLMVNGVWTGPHASQVVRQFDGEQAELHGDSIHFWPYGLNYDSEGSELNKQRQVAVVYAMRADLGIGSSSHPSTASTVTLTADDPLGESSFNFKTRWSDGYFPHSSADYFTGDHAIRTPTGTNSYTFYGRSLTVNNTTDSLGLYFKGQGASAAITVDDLILDGGWIHHLNGVGDVFELAGELHVASDSHIRAKQGNIDILSAISGSSSLTIEPTDSPDANNRYVTFLSPSNTFTGDLINAARFELADGAKFVFAIGANGVNNRITGAGAYATLLDGVFEIDLTAAGANVGDAWTLVDAADTEYGATFEVSGFVNEDGLWTNGAYAFDQATGILTVIPPPTTWSVDGGGAWGTASNWTDGVPVYGEQALFGDTLTAGNAPASITLDVPAALSILTFDNPNTYIITGEQTLTLVDDAAIEVSGGSHDLDVVVAGNNGLIKFGEGVLTLHRQNSVSGVLRIAAGTLALVGQANLAGAEQIIIEPGATLDVDSLDSTFVLSPGQSLINNSAAGVIGDIRVSDGATLSGTGTFSGMVNIDLNGALQIGADGLSSVTPIPGQVTYVDTTYGTTGNTLRANDRLFSPQREGETGSDNNWERRSLGNNTTVEAGGETPEDAYEIKTTVTGLNPQEPYNVYAFFWDPESTDEDWNIRAGFASNPNGNQLFAAADASRALRAMSAPLASMLDFLTAPLLTEDGRVMLAAEVGVATADESGAIAVFIDDMPSSIGADRRTLYDGVGVAQINAVTLNIDGNLSIAPDGVLAADIANASNYDRIEVNGDFAAAGTLVLRLGPGADPQPGDAFDIVDATSFTGAFSSFAGDTLPNDLLWDLRQLHATGVVSVVTRDEVLAEYVDCVSGPESVLTGDCTAQDFDNDGDNDLRDYAIWQRCVAAPSGALLGGCLAAP